MVRRLLTVLATFLLVTALFTFTRYRAWLAETGQRLEAASTVVETTRGPIELARYGTSDRVLLLLHGTPGGYDQVVKLGQRASELGYQPLAVSRPGYLRTPLDVGRSPADQADAYAALLDALEIPSVAVIGFSGGGPSALEFAVRHPDRCWALVDLMGVSRARLPDEPFAGDDVPALMRWLLGSNFGGWMLSGMVRRNPERLVQSLIVEEGVQRRILDDPDKLSSFVELTESVLILPERRSAGSQNDITGFEHYEPPALERISAPTLVLHGTADRNVPLAMGQLVADRVPGAKLVTFEGADHFMVVSHVDEVFGELFRFLDAVGPAARNSVSGDRVEEPAD